MSIQYAFPPHTMFYCRACEAATPHALRRMDRGYIFCDDCGHRTHAVEVVTTYATDFKWGRWEVLPPFDALLPRVQAAKVFGHDWRSA